MASVSQNSMRLELIAQSSSKSTGQHPPELNQVLLVHQLRAMLHRFEQIFSFQTQNAFYASVKPGPSRKVVYQQRQ